MFIGWEEVSAWSIGLSHFNLDRTFCLKVSPGGGQPQYIYATRKRDWLMQMEAKTIDGSLRRKGYTPSKHDMWHRMQ